MAERTIKQVDRAVPVVIGVTAGSADWAVTFARHAQDKGADAVIAMPPSGRPATEVECFRYYEKLCSVLQVPLFVQNHDAPLGTRMSSTLVTRIVRELPYADWIKEETIPAGHAITAEIAHSGPKLKGVMGGIAGRYLFDEYARGACGTMPACESVDIHAQSGTSSTVVPPTRRARPSPACCRCSTTKQFRLACTKQCSAGAV